MILLGASMSERYLEYITNVAEQWLPLGEKVLVDGTRLIGHLPHVASLAWFHRLYSGLDSHDCKCIERDAEIVMPPTLRDLYSVYNGFSLFSGNIGLYGRREKVGIDENLATYGPLSIQTTNVYERPRRSPKDIVFFGYYKDDGSELVVCQKS